MKNMFDLDNDDEDINLQESDNNDHIINDTGKNITNSKSFHSKDSIEDLINKEEDFLDTPQGTFLPLLKSYLEKNHLTMVTFPEIREKSILNKSNQRNKITKIKPIIKVKAALLKKIESLKAKDFNFKHSPEQDYYFLITKELNPNYMKPIIQGNQKKKRMGKDRRESKEGETKESNKIENIKINLNFDYNKYILKALIVFERNGKIEVFHQEELNREVCQVSHTTKDSITYYRKSKPLKTEREKDDLLLFELNSEKYFIIEIEHKKPASETIIREDGILSVCYLITPEKKVAMNIYTIIKYSLHFIKETLCNYIGKYIHDMIYDFCHLPSECFEDYLSHIGSVTKTLGKKYKLVFPLKKYIKDVGDLSRKCLISHIYRNLPNISRTKASDRIPFHKFIFLYEKYKLYFEEKEFKIKQKYFNSDKYQKQRKKYEFLEQSFIKDSISDKITKETKIDINKLLTIYFGILEKYLKENLSTDREKIKEFLLPSLAKFLNQYSAFKGFLNIDIVRNEDNKFEFQCSNNKNCNKTINEKMFGCVVKSLKCINFFFGFNDGFYHEHFNIMDYSYNFNEKNIVHTFLTINDSSKKNRIRVFDIPFMNKWCFEIASLLFTIYRDSFGFLCNKDYLEKQKTQIDFHSNFANLFSKINDNIQKELYIYYEKVFPEYFEFCYKTSEAPLDKYNLLDNLCQNFSKKSLYCLLKNNVIFFTPFEVVFEEELRHSINNLINKPQLDQILEPYLVLVDKDFKDYLKQKENKEEYLEKIGMKKKTFFNVLQNINIEKLHYTVFLLEKKEKEEIEIETNDIDDDEKIGEDNDKEEETDNKELIISTSETPEEKQNEKLIEKTESIISDNSEQIEEEKAININEAYPKKMHNVSLVKVDLPKIGSSPYHFYYLLNLYYNYTYDTMKELKKSFVDYDTLKRFIASIESSVTISFSDYDKTIMTQINKKGKSSTQSDSSDAKKLKKGVKKDIINCLKIMAKLTRMTRHMNAIFLQYMTKVINDIIKGNKTIKEKIGDEKNLKGNDYYMKIGHFLVNFNAYKNNSDSYEEFKKSEIFKELEKEDHYLEVQEPMQEKLIIDK